MKLSIRSRLGACWLAAVLGCTALTGCSGSSQDTSDTEAPVSSAVEETEAAAEAPSETEPPATEHVSPTEQVTSVLGTQIDTDATLDRDSEDDTQKNYKMSLSDFIEDGDVIQSFTFVFYAADGTSDIGTYQGGCGISVNADCAAATDPGWFQSPDFSAQAEGSYAEVKWDVPGDVAPYVPASGEIQVGYWWGDTAKVTLKNVICTYTRTKTLPVDGTQTIPVGQSLNFGSDTTNSVKVPLADVLGENGVPQAVTFDISAGGTIGKFTGAFGITTGDWYQTGTIAVPTESGSLSLTWILPDSIKPSVPQNAEVMLGYWWGEVSDITLNSITVKYSTGSSTSAVQQPVAEGNGEKKPVTTEGQAAEIAASIKAGWCLGNTLDCYDIDWVEDDFETAWGNVRTTQEIIDTVKAAGFNAVRIPVSWTDHMDDSGNVEAAWMDRVQEVVDYAMDDGLYTILNVHHDDYTWIHPVYAEEEAVTVKFVHLWEQIAERFQDYDTHLLFEGLNEPRMVGSANEWMGGTDEERDVINHLLQKFVDTVRASGGKNPERTLVVTTHAASITDAALNGFVLPSDDNLILSIHSYAPWQFANILQDEETQVTVFDSAGEAELNSGFDKLYDKFVSKGIPVIIGEFGAENKDNAADRARYYSYYIQAAAQRGIPCFIWDNGLAASFGLLDRAHLSWYDGTILHAIQEAIQ